MPGSLDAQISSVVRSEVGTLTGTTDAVIIRIEVVPLADEHPSDRPSVEVLILDKAKATRLHTQLLDALSRFTSAPACVAH